MNRHYTRSRPGFTVLLCIIGVLLFQACKKADRDVVVKDELITTAPYSLTAKDNKQVAKVFKELNKRGLSEGAFTRYGKLLWDKSIVLPYAHMQSTASRAHNGIDSVVITPIVPENTNEVTAYLQAWIGDTVSLVVYTKHQYTSLAFGNTLNNGIGEAEKLALQFMRLNKLVFNYTAFQITDKGLFTGNLPVLDTAKAGVLIRLREPENNISGRLRYVELCVDIIRTNCTTPTAPQCMPTCDNCPGYCQTTETICTGWWEDDNPGGGEGPSLPDPGDGSGGGTNLPGPGDPCGGGRIIGARLPPCGGGGGGTGVGSGGGWIPIVPDENQWFDSPPDSALIKASLAINKLADSIYSQLSVPNNWEYMFPIFGNNDNITTGIVRTDQQENSVTPKNMIKSGWQTIGMWHGHQGKGAETARMPHSHADIDYLRRHAGTKNFISFVDCGNKRFALIITDVVKAKQFFINNNELQIYSNYKLPSGPQSGTIQHLRSLCVTNAIGSITNNGIGFYSADGPNFDNFILLNP